MKKSKTREIVRYFIGTLLIIAGIGHLTFDRNTFTAQVPEWLHVNKDLVVIISGIIELLLGSAYLLLKKKKKEIGYVLALFFVVIFPGNIYQYTHQIDAFGLNTDLLRLIRLFFQPMLILGSLWASGCYPFKRKTNCEKNFYDFSAEDIKGKTINMHEFEGKVVLVVNTASKCGLTPQFEGLENLYKKYEKDGLVILGFPCNQFAKQEPGSNETIEEFCTINYGVTFNMFAKIDVNGNNAHPLFNYLKCELGGCLNDSIKWNFTKFLIDRNGKPVIRFAPTVTPNKIENYISSLLYG